MEVVMTQIMTWRWTIGSERKDLTIYKKIEQAKCRCPDSYVAYGPWLSCGSLASDHQRSRGGLSFRENAAIIPDEIFT